MKTNRINITPYFILALIFTALSACGTHVGNPEEDASAGTPIKNKPRDVDERVVFALSHNSYDEAQSLLLYIDRLSLRKTALDDQEAEGEDSEGSPWLDIDLDSQEPIDLLSLTSGEIFNFAGSSSIPNGTYEELRLILDPEQAARMVLSDGSEHLLKVPGGEESGIKIKENITIDGETNNLYVMNFDLQRSIISIGGESADATPGQENPGNGRGNRLFLQEGEISTGRYMLKPVIRVVKETESGTLSGESPRGNQVCVYNDIADADQVPECGQAIAIGRVKNGRYHLPFLPNGTYDLRIFDSEGNYEDVLDVEVDKKRVLN
ncbi:MAG: DUF4382 domain-containing protein [Oligoflexus sp.]